MKNILWLPLLLSLLNVTAQKNGREQKIGISVPVIWTQAEGLYFSLGNPRYSSGTTTNYGINLQYQRTVYKNFSGCIGFGYFHQGFNIKRPFKYADPDSTKLLYHTSSYSYENLHLLVGLTYKKRLDKNYKANAGINYSHLLSYRQKYVVSEIYGATQVNDNHLPLCDMIGFQLGVERYLGKRFSVEMNCMVSLYTKWRNDNIFYWFSYSDESQLTATSSFSAGTTLSINYHF